MKDSIVEAVAGAASGAVSKTIMAPLDRLKLVVQLRGEIQPSPATTTASSSTSSSSSSYSGPISALRTIIRQEGVLALWRGNVPTILIQGGSSALNFVFMDLWKKSSLLTNASSSSSSSNMISTTTPAPSTSTTNIGQYSRSFVSAALGGATSMTILYPLGLIRTKLALDMGNGLYNQRKYHGMKDVVMDSVRTNGITSLFQGYNVALVSVTVYRMIHLGGYDALKDYWLTEKANYHEQRMNKTTDNNNISLSWWERLIIAQIVSMTATTVHYPLDSVRRRLMMQSDVQNKRYKSTLDCIQQIIQKEGIRGFYRGLGTSYVRSVGAALLLLSYDFFKTLLIKS